VGLPPLVASNGRIAWFCFVVRLPMRFTAASRDLVIQEMAARGIQCRAYFSPVHKMQPYSQYAKCHLPVTTSLSSRTLALPFFNQITSSQILEVCQSLQKGDRRDFSTQLDS
jgi:dTDP-4-amino-4,6-dideoxygalactose transaminase